MDTKLNKNIFLKNIIYAFLSQGLSLCLSILTSLILPKFLGVTQYGYFQLFIFYASYAGFSSLGLNDGIYLRFGGKRPEDFNKDLLGSQLIISLSIQLIIIFFLSIFILHYSNNEVERTFVLFSVLLYTIFHNISGFIGYIFQAINDTKMYSKSILIEKIFFFLFLLLIIVFNIKMVYLYVIVFIFAKIISCIYCIIKGRAFITFKKINILTSFNEYRLNIKVGINLMIANIASMLILGIARQFIDFKWGIQSFGKFSFLLSIINFFLLFISQISMVLFPQLRLSTPELQSKIYLKIRRLILFISPIILLSYHPITIILSKWLPKYSDSLYYLIYLLPLCIFEIKTSILSNTFLKVFHMEKKLLLINSLSLITSLLFSILGVFVFNSMEFIIIGVVLSLGLRSIISELLLANHFSYNVMKYITFDLLIIACFIGSNLIFSYWTATIIYLFFYIIVLFFSNLHKTI